MSPPVEPQNFATFEDKVRHVFRKVWDDFYAWEHDYCEQIIRKTIKPPPSKPLQSLSELRAQIDNRLAQKASRSSNSIASSKALSPNLRDTGDCIVTPFGPNGELDHAQAERLHFEHIEIGSGDVLDVEHFGEYEGCAPLDRSIFIGDDADHMPFVPFADDCSFDHLEHIQHYSYLAWQTKKSKPDVEYTILETAARLVQDRWDGMPVLYRHIDETCLFPVSLEGQEGAVVGLLHKAGQRDFPPWPEGDPRRFLDDLRRRLPQANDFTGRLNSVNQVFCPNLNCIEPFCLTHTNHVELRTTRKPPSSQDTIMALVKKPCSNSCFIWNEVGMDSFMMVQWSKSDKDELRALLRAEPNTIPCDLAVIMEKPCREVFEMRPSALPSIDAIERKTRKNQMKQTKQKFVDDDSDRFTPGDPCNHTGPCTQQKCPCFVKRGHCERNCHCSRTCIRRWRGCRCASAENGEVCRTKKCPCYRESRECDPELCQPCNARGAKGFLSEYPTCVDKRTDGDAGLCRNCALQRREAKAVEVRVGRWGLGLHLLEPVKSGSLVIEYVGEIILPATMASRDDVARHRGRNYVFGLNETYQIDAGNAGNPARYINHAPEEEANCKAHVYLVNGEHRIGIFAARDVDVGEELLLFYGTEFFENL